MFDASGRLQQVNQRAHAADAFSMQEPPTSLRELWERESPTRVSATERLSFLESPGMRAMSGNIVEHELLTVRRGAGNALRLVEVFAAPVRDDDGQVIGVMLVDLDVDERLPGGTAQQAVHSRDRRLSAVGQLAAGIMHEVNNALNPIMAAAFLLRHHAESPDRVRDYAERIRVAAETAAATASRVGRFIRQEPVHVGGDERIDLSLLAREVIDLVAPMRLRHSNASGAVEISCMLDDAVPTRGLPGELRVALLNIVQNAIDAMPDGGILTVRTYVEHAEACISITDSGLGMSSETRNRAFEPFFSTGGVAGS